ncbi:unnamed protein product [Prorocentrum cordatum]|uniref:Uncharacterized protein n=1 Tax=Prorocentrum cordatum TaxID=2364126 RepID=A0ABN9XHA8_9DINO|nr:unnamed protein product [Polarella glacialis]
MKLKDRDLPQPRPLPPRCAEAARAVEQLHNEASASQEACPPASHQLGRSHAEVDRSAPSAARRAAGGSPCSSWFTLPPFLYLTTDLSASHRPRSRAPRRSRAPTSASCEAPPCLGMYSTGIASP